MPHGPQSDNRQFIAHVGTRMTLCVVVDAVATLAEVLTVTLADTSGTTHAWLCVMLEEHKLSAPAVTTLVTRRVRTRVPGAVCQVHHRGCITATAIQSYSIHTENAQKTHRNTQKTHRNKRTGMAMNTRSPTRR